MDQPKLTRVEIDMLFQFIETCSVKAMTARPVADLIDKLKLMKTLLEAEPKTGEQAPSA